MERSSSFSSTYGVCQGGILSPLLFNIYVDILRNKIKNERIGCWIGNYFYGALSYADDICILSPTMKGLQEMLNTCDIYSREFSMNFNPKKTICIKFSKYDTIANVDLYLSGQKLLWVSNVKHLGNWVSHNLSEESEINRKCGIIYGAVNNFKSYLKHVGFRNLMVLFNSYCCSVYGS